MTINKENIDSSLAEVHLQVEVTKLFLNFLLFLGFFLTVMGRLFCIVGRAKQVQTTICFTSDISGSALLNWSIVGRLDWFSC